MLATPAFLEISHACGFVERIQDKHETQEHELACGPEHPSEIRSVFTAFIYLFLIAQIGQRRINRFQIKNLSRDHDGGKEA
ncbi:unnamed protein product [Allacma fusca]|uniref:Uncharacterized protein n=1 Tax=Allacma fusca TaxID=39272 RepID=A0A8J2L9C4_9HEXA|nr:unnamed protein product [Allacma fusca]